MKDIAGVTASALRNSVTLHEEGERFINEDANRVFELQAVDGLMRELAKPSSKPFYTVSQRGVAHPQATPLGKRLINAVKYDLDEIRVLYPKAKFSPYFELFDAVVSPMRDRLQWLDHVSYPAWAELARSIKSSLGSRDFAARRRAHERGVRKNYIGLVRYLRDMQSFNSKLLIVRLDVGYKVEYSQHVSFETMQQDKDKLVEFILKSGQGAHVGHALKIEHGQTRGFHTHMLCVYNGQRVQQDVIIAKAIGDHWVREITGGKGYYHNCNAHKEDYHFLGIGMVNHYDEKAKAALELVAAYMTKPDYHVRLLAPSRARIYGRTEYPKNTPAKIKAALQRRKVAARNRRTKELTAADDTLLKKLLPPRGIPVPRKMPAPGDCR
jgi:hypothetical protein